MNLETMLAPHDLDVFFQQFWESQSLHIQRDDPAYFANLFSLAGMDRAIAHLPRADMLKMVSEGKGQKSFSSDERCSLSNVYDHFYQGYTIILNGMHHYWDPIANLARALTRQIGFEAQVNIYITPKGATGFNKHWDGHDVFILQVHGEKDWRLYDGGPDLPDETGEDPARPQTMSECGSPTQEITLRPGDVLYIPRGKIHQASSTHSTSIHLTVGVMPRTWADLLMAGISSAAKKDLALRRNLPPGSLLFNQRHVFNEKASEMLQSLLGQIDWKEGASLLRLALINHLSHVPQPHFQQLESQVDLIDATTTVELLEDNLLAIDRYRDTALLFFPGGFQSGPDKLEWAFNFIASNSRFKVSDIPGWFSENEKVMLVKRLVRQGLLRVA